MDCQKVDVDVRNSEHSADDDKIDRGYEEDTEEGVFERYLVGDIRHAVRILYEIEEEDIGDQQVGAHCLAPRRDRDAPERPSLHEVYLPDKEMRGQGQGCTACGDGAEYDPWQVLQGESAIFPLAENEKEGKSEYGEDEHAEQQRPHETEKDGGIGRHLDDSEGELFEGEEQTGDDEEGPLRAPFALHQMQADERDDHRRSGERECGGNVDHFDSSNLLYCFSASSARAVPGYRSMQIRSAWEALVLSSSSFSYIDAAAR